ncbi:phosphate transporter [Pilobolus umbonatus]|nr:phosphate transporter [Pilobolus umbonatus]
MEVHDYTWIYGFTVVIAFFDAYGIGANDVANSFATSVASGSLTLPQACIIACFTEFSGAILLGSHTADTSRGGILLIERFEGTPEILMLAMSCALFASASWVLFATKNGWPVSTTHSLVGVGVGIAVFGGSSIDWSWTGIASIVTSWFLSPVLAGILGAIIYLSTEYSILRRKDSIKWALRIIPVYFFITATMRALSYLKWCTGRVVHREEVWWYHILVIHFIGPRPTKTCSTPAETNESTLETGNQKDDKEDKHADENAGGVKVSIKDEVLNVLLHGVRKDVRNLMITACMASFAHGSNDVANAVGALSSVYDIWRTAKVDLSNSVPVPIWIPVYAGAAIDIGLATFGYRIMRVLGATAAVGLCKGSFKAVN